MDAALVNRLLEARVKDLAARPPAGTPEDRRRSLRRCLGLDPIPPRPKISAEPVGIIQRDGYRIEKLKFESVEGVTVPAHLYIGDEEGKRPLVLRPHGHWPLGMRSTVVQAGAISLALCGFACLVVAAPGVAADGVNDNDLNERRAMGRHDDPFLAMGAPVQGRYVWDLIRALDCLDGREDIDMAHVGITTEASASDTAAYTFAIDERITAVALAAGFESRELYPAHGCPCRSVPAAVLIGDRSDILALRAPHGAVMLLAAEGDQVFPLDGHNRTDEKLRRAYRSRQGEGNYRYERFFGGHDYNRRMREAVLAFFNRHLKALPAEPLCPEPRPLTDGHLNPYPSGTVDPADPELQVLTQEEPSGRTFWQLLDEALADPQPQPYNVDQRLVAWKKYGHIPSIKPGAIFAIHDSTVSVPQEPASLALPECEVDIRLGTLLGLSVAESLAQIFHVALPGGPESWESSTPGVSADPFTSMIASMKTLVTTPEAPPKVVVAEGPVASLVTRFLARYRPGLQVQASHTWTDWQEAFTQAIPQNAQPLARYLDWI